MKDKILYKIKKIYEDTDLLLKIVNRSHEAYCEQTGKTYKKVDKNSILFKKNLNGVIIAINTIELVSLYLNKPIDEGFVFCVLEKLQNVDDEDSLEIKTASIISNSIWNGQQPLQNKILKMNIFSLLDEFEKKLEHTQIRSTAKIIYKYLKEF